MDTPTATLKIVQEIAESLQEDAWRLYWDAFEDLDGLAVQRHLMYRDEFNDVMLDRRIDKYLALDDAGQLCGLATLTNNLHAVPLVSWRYFQRRWPDLYEERRLWYIGFMAVSPAGHAVGAFDVFLEAMYRQVASTAGKVALDMCRRNADVKHLGRAIGARLCGLTGGVTTTRMDEQSYWLYEFPPIPAGE